MEQLTIEYAIANKYSGIDCVKYFKPHWTDEECDYYLWNMTCFPFSLESMITQLNNAFLNKK